MTIYIQRKDIDAFTPVSDARITNVKSLSSYNWIEAPTPTIAVPGKPAAWSPPSGRPRKLPQDSGLIYIAQNAARHPDSPLEPLFRALYIVKPDFDIRSIGVISDRNNIRKLIACVNPGIVDSRDGLKGFTVKVEVVNHTTIFCREEIATTEFIGPGEFRGFGHEFEKAYTKDSVGKSAGHFRTVSYTFGGMSFVIRHETDAYDPSDDLSNLLTSLSVSSTTDKTGDSDVKVTTPPGSQLTIHHQGTPVPISSTIEIKTKVAHKIIDLSDVAPQLWVSQTLKLVRAYHRGGIFQTPSVQDVSDHISAWEEKNEKELGKLGALIKEITAKVKELGGRATVIYDPFKDQLEVRKTGAEEDKMLPGDLYRNWEQSAGAIKDKDPGEANGDDSDKLGQGSEKTQAEEQGNKDDSGHKDDKNDSDSDRSDND